ncbi:MAG: Charged multivesicular body protein 1b [Paramarteilia canceri]
MDMVMMTNDSMNSLSSNNAYMQQMLKQFNATTVHDMMEKLDSNMEKMAVMGLSMDGKLKETQADLTPENDIAKLVQKKAQQAQVEMSVELMSEIGLDTNINSTKAQKDPVELNNVLKNIRDH